MASTQLLGRTGLQPMSVPGLLWIAAISCASEAFVSSATEVFVRREMDVQASDEGIWPALGRVVVTD
jgi:hypothetical protein